MYATKKHSESLLYIPPTIRRSAITRDRSNASLDSLDSLRKVFKQPISPQKAVEKYNELMNINDLDDLTKVDQVYYLNYTQPHAYYYSTSNADYFKFIEGNHINFRYEQLGELGRGSFGSVIKCIDHKTEQLVAVKTIKSFPEDRNQVEMEIKTLTLIDSQENGSAAHHVINIIDKFMYHGFTCIVTPLLSIDLYTYLKYRNFEGLKDTTLRHIGRQIADALAFTHRAKICHSDLKPENILLNDNYQKSITVIDYGCACFHKQPLYSTVQSLYYRSPEVIFKFKYGVEIDVWSFGCVLFELATGEPLFHALDEEDLIRLHRELLGQPPMEMVQRSRKMQRFFQVVQADRERLNHKKKRLIEQRLPGADPDFIDLLCSCLEWLPAKRIKMEEVLEHPFFQK